MPVQLPDINLTLLLPELLIAVLAMILLLAGAWWEGTDRQNLTTEIGIGGLGIIIILTALFFPSMAQDGHTTFGGQFRMDPFAFVTKLLMLLATLLTLAMSVEFLRDKKLPQGEYMTLTLFALMGGMVMASSGSFLVLYLGLELMSLSIYVLAAIQRDDQRSNEAGLKYFVLGSVASGLILYGISLLYGSSGTIEFHALREFFHSDAYHGNLAVTVGLMLIVAGLAFKMAAAPFHMWAPDVYEGAPTSVTAFMAAMPKVAAFAAIFRVLVETMQPLQSHWIDALKVIALLSLAVGAFAAIAQTNMKRMLAYSSIGHVGYALIGLVAGNEIGLQSVMVYITIYIFMNMGTFALILVLNKDGIGEDINDYKGLAQKRPRLAFLMGLFMFSMAGLPPLAGFIGKLYVFLAAIQAQLYILAALAVLFSAVGAYYYLRIVKFMYFDAPESEFSMPMHALSKIVVGCCAIIIVLLGIFPSPLLGVAQNSIQAFM
jgi:NADH-quinone oxidoreductase subunit N